MAVEVDANRQVVERFRQAAESGNMEELTKLQMEIAAPDFVNEWPQSGERIRGSENFQALYSKYEGATGTSPSMKPRRITGEGNLYVLEGTIDYGDGVPVSYVGIAEFADGKIKKMTEYFANPFEAPEWRKPYVERMD